jgi:hypothetical protein
MDTSSFYCLNPAGQPDLTVTLPIAYWKGWNGCCDRNPYEYHSFLLHPCVRISKLSALIFSFTGGGSELDSLQSEFIVPVDTLASLPVPPCL